MVPHSFGSYATSAGLVVVGGLQLSEWGVILGIIAAVITTIINAYYRRQHFRAAREVADATIAAEQTRVKFKRAGNTRGEVLYQVEDDGG